MTTQPRDNQVILGLETTTTLCSVAVWDGQQYFEAVTETPRSQSKSILPMVAEVLTTADLSMNDVDAVACARGPGSFTGVRIGIGVAKGLAFGQDIAIIPVSPLQAIAYQAIKQQCDNNSLQTTITAVMDARMGELYAAEYRINNGLPQLVGDERLVTLDDLTVAGHLVAGTGILEYREPLLACAANLCDVYYPYAQTVIELARLQALPTVSAADFSPTYLRNKVTD